MSNGKSKGKSKGKRKKRVGRTAPATSVAGAPVDPARVDAVVHALAHGTAPPLPPAGLSDAEFQRVAERLVADRAPRAVERLAAIPHRKLGAKALKRAAFRLEQLGHPIQLPEVPASNPGAAIGAAALPALMAPPMADAGRRFTLARRGGSQVELIELLFEHPVGLQRLQSSSTSRPELAAWVSGMTSSRGVGLPQRVRVDPRLLQRKLWEAAQCIRGGRTGGEVDPGVARSVVSAAAQPEHPMASATPASGRILGAAELASRSYRVAALIHDEPMRVLRQHWREQGGGRMWVEGQPSAIDGHVADWAEQWGYENIRETFLDVAAFCVGFDDPDGAATFRAAAVVADPRRGLVPLLQGFVAHHFAENA